MIHVCYVTNDGYCSHAAVSAVSVFENNRNEDVCVHILAENISEESRRRLEKTAEPYPKGQIDIIDCTDYVQRIQEEYAPQGWKGTCNAYLYVFTEEIFPEINRVLWIDCDMVVLSSLKELWETDLEGKLSGVVLDVPSFLSLAPDDPFWQTKFYFNGGFLLLNLKEYRARHMDAVLQERLRRDGARFRFPDQTLLNLEFPEEDVVHLDLRYDFPAGISDRSYRWEAGLNRPEKPTFTIQEYEQARKNVVILHYIGGSFPNKPWFTDCKVWGGQYYRYYRSISPYADIPLKTFAESRKDASLVRLYTKPYDTLPLSVFSRGAYHLHRLLVRKNKF